jgi:ABC-type multidrug transport system fused ATPase/permease subunit
MMGGGGPGPGGPNSGPNIDDETLSTKVDVGLIARLFPYIKPYAWYFVLALVCMLIVSAAGLVGPLLIQRAIDVELPSGDAAGLLITTLLFVGTYLVNWIGTYWQTYFMSWAGQKIVFNVRQALFEHLQTLNFDYFDHIEVGRLMSRVTNDVNALSDLVSSGIINVINDAFMLIGIMAVMLSMNFRLALLAFATLPFLVVVAARFGRQMQRAYYKVRGRIAAVAANLQESISGIRVVQSFSREDTNAGYFNRTNQANMQANMEAARLDSLFMPVVDIIAAAGVCTVLWYGGTLVHAGILKAGAVYAFISYVNRFFMPVRDLSDVYTVWQSATVSARRITDIIDTPPKVQDAPGAIDLPEIKGEVKFDHVTFGYDPKLPILRNLNFAVQPGQTVALVGETGAGKSSTINLLARFYDPQEGAILIDGHDLRSVTQKSLHKQVGIVLQDTFIFAGTIRDNIRYGRPDATDEEVEQAARTVNAHDFIMRLPEGYDTEVHERGSRLSIGQRQLIAFARALLTDPRILILDEATANIDAYTELLIQRAMAKLLAGRTAVVIAHRLSTIRNADRIYVFDRGKIVEEGNHQSLLARPDGVYRNLYDMQFAGMKEVAE